MVRFRVLCIQLRCAIFSPTFAAASIIFAAALYVSVWSLQRNNSVVYGVEMSMFSMDVLVIAILPSLPFALSYQSEHRQRALGSYYIRADVSTYIAAKFTAAAVSGACVVLAGYMVYIAALLPFHPFDDGMMHNFNSFQPLYESGHPFLYVMCYIASYSMSGALFAGMTMLLSMYFPERYTAVIMPYIIYMLLTFALEMLGVPPALRPSKWMLGYMDLGTPLASLAVKFGITSGMLAAGGFACMHRAERRLLSE